MKLNYEKIVSISNQREEFLRGYASFFAYYEHRLPAGYIYSADPLLDGLGCLSGLFGDGKNKLPRRVRRALFGLQLLIVFLECHDCYGL